MRDELLHGTLWQLHLPCPMCDVASVSDKVASGSSVQNGKPTPTLVSKDRFGWGEQHIDDCSIDA